MAGRRFKVGPRITVQLNNDEFERIRKTPPLQAMFEAMGAEWVDRLNTELRAAETSRGQPAEDGYTHHISTEGTRIRMQIVAVTARAQAHEKKHSSILKLMRTTNFDVESRNA